MTINVINLQNEFAVDQNNLSPEAMAIAVDRLKNVLALERIHFNCFVLAKSLGDEPNELIPFLVELNQKKASLAENSRFHFILKNGTHWINTDVRVNKGKLEFYLIDAANSLRHVLDEVITLYKYCPDARLSYTGLGIQVDRENCAYFGLDIAATCAQLPELHTQIQPCINSGKIGVYTDYSHYIEDIKTLRPGLFQGLDQEVLMEGVKKIHYIPAANFPKHFGEFLKNNQNFGEYRDKFAYKGYFLFDKSSLDGYIGMRTEEYQEFPGHPIQKRNNGIVIERDSTKKAILRYLKSLAESKLDYLIAERQNLNAKPFVETTSVLSHGFFGKMIVDVKVEKMRNTSEDSLQTSNEQQEFESTQTSLETLQISHNEQDELESYWHCRLI